MSVISSGKIQKIKTSQNKKKLKLYHISHQKRTELHTLSLEIFFSKAFPLLQHTEELIFSPSTLSNSSKFFLKKCNLSLHGNSQFFHKTDRLSTLKTVGQLESEHETIQQSARQKPRSEKSREVRIRSGKERPNSTHPPSLFHSAAPITMFTVTLRLNLTLKTPEVINM